MTLPRLRASTPARLLLCAATLVVLGGCSSGDADPASDTASASSDPTSSSAEPSQSAGQASAPARPKLISYAGDDSLGTTIRTTADTDKLDGAPDAFKTYIGRTADRLSADTDCAGDDVGVTVQALHTDGYAVGSVNDCGGYVALWAVVDGDWKEIDATQDLWDCAALNENRVPGAIAGDSCYDTDAQAQRSYQRA